MMLLVRHYAQGGRVVGADATELVPLERDLLATFRVQRGHFHVSQEVVDASDDELDDVTPLARAIMAALDRAGVAGRRVRLSHVKDDTGRLYTWRIVSTWIRPA